MITPGNNFFDMFTFDVENDPTNDYVNYLDASDAQAANLAGVVDGVVTIRSDSSNIASGRGRESVRVTSRNQYTHGLVNLDLAHMPGSSRGVWPAFWMTGPSVYYYSLHFFFFLYPTPYHSLFSNEPT